MNNNLYPISPLVGQDGEHTWDLVVLSHTPGQARMREALRFLNKTKLLIIFDADSPEILSKM